MAGRLAAIAIVGATLLVLSWSATTGEAVSESYGATVDRYGIDLVPYAKVRRSDGTYRRMLTQPATLSAVAAGALPPEGARIFMETYYRPGQVSTVFHMEKKAGRWAYGSFSAGSPNLATRTQASCLSCHAGAADRDLVYTLPSLRVAAEGGGESDFLCDRGGRRPCDAEVYERGAGP